jgi:bifunctional DNA-binding transcriptional regulator/antitoxin component of YhaV-PrlF toxin-antitoxin module
MGSRVGPKGQVVISKPTRDRLGIGPGWEALEQVVDDHVELYFIPPPHERSLKGSLAEHIRKRLPPTDWSKAREAAWSRAAREKERRRRKG